MGRLARCFTTRSTGASIGPLLSRHCLRRCERDARAPRHKGSHYHGIDLSEPALELAANNLKDMPFEVELDHRDFVEAMKRRPEPADASWYSLSIHHLETASKLHMMRAIR